MKSLSYSGERDHDSLFTRQSKPPRIYSLSCAKSIQRSSSETEHTWEANQGDGIIVHMIVKENYPDDRAIAHRSPAFQRKWEPLELITHLRARLNVPRAETFVNNKKRACRGRINLLANQGAGASVDGLSLAWTSCTSCMYKFYS